MVLAWLVIGSLLLLFELHHRAFYALFGTIGSIAAAAVAFFAPSALPEQVGVGVAVATVGVLALRPYVSRAFETRHTGHVARGVHGGLVGAEAITLDGVGDRHVVGHVRLYGERWLAVSGAGTTIAPETNVLVAAVQGTTLVVWPIDGTEAGRIEPGQNQLPRWDEAPDGANGGTP